MTIWAMISEKEMVKTQTKCMVKWQLPALISEAHADVQDVAVRVSAEGSNSSLPDFRAEINMFTV